MTQPPRRPRELCAPEADVAQVRESAAPASTPEAYVISIRGCLGASLFDSFAPLRVSTGNGRTELHGDVEDQAALYGILARIQSLGLHLDEVVRLQHGPDRGGS